MLPLTFLRSASASGTQRRESVLSRQTQRLRVSGSGPLWRSFGVVFSLVCLLKVIRDFCIDSEQEMQNFRINLEHSNFSCKSVRECVRFALRAILNCCSHMTLRASLLRELVNPNLSVGGRAELCCELAKDFENRGEYEEAREVLSVFWPGIGERPKLEGLDRSHAAEVLLRAGVLTGWIGSNRQIADAQEIAKNLISESLTIFQSL